MYKSPLFRGAKNYAESRCGAWFILSAKYGLVEPSRLIDPYNESLYQMSDSERELWAKQAYSDLRKLLKPGCSLIFLAGDAYRTNLQRFARADGILSSAPLSSLGIGQQVAWLQKVEAQSKRLAHMDRLYQLLDRVGKTNAGAQANFGGMAGQPLRDRKGLYFFFESSEFRMTAPKQPRVVRIGTHAVSAGSKSTLWNRLRTHRGASNGQGNHRGSIFRLHVGQSLIHKAGLEQVFPTWGIGQSADASIRIGEEEIELEVSEYIRNMRVLWLEIPDAPSPDSDRGFLERNLIALLSGPTGPLDLPSKHWLGAWSTRPTISTSGLWNVNHVLEEYDPMALDVLEAYVEMAEGNRKYSLDPRAPLGWRTSSRQPQPGDQQLKLNI